MTSELFEKSRHWCRRCERTVERVLFVKKESGETLFTAVCHHDRLEHLASRSEMEDLKQLDFFEPLPTPEQQTLSESASFIFNITTALDELIDQRLVVFKPGALLPSLSKRGRELRDHRKTARARGAGD